jgi:cold shock CspA family protein
MWHVATYDPNRGFGFIRPDRGGRDYFAHDTGLLDAAVIEPGQRVEFETRVDERRGSHKRSTSAFCFVDFKIAYSTCTRYLPTMKEIVELLAQSWPTLLMAASGYAAYYVANVGVRDHHKPADMVFSIILFAFVSAFAFYFSRWVLDLSLVSSSGIAFVFAMFGGAVWRVQGRPRFERLLRVTRVSHSDDLPSAWIALFDERCVTTQLTVQLKDGSWLMCDDLSKFRASPNGPCVLGAKGDILMYVTDKRANQRGGFVAMAPIDPEWGHEITYIPADQIIRVDLRRHP